MKIPVLLVLVSVIVVYPSEVTFQVQSKLTDNNVVETPIDDDTQYFINSTVLPGFIKAKEKLLLRWHFMFYLQVQLDWYMKCNRNM